VSQIKLQKLATSTLYGNYLPLSGGTVTGISYFTSGLSADALSAGSITMFGDIDMQKNIINDLYGIQFNTVAASAHTHSEGFVY